MTRKKTTEIRRKKDEIGDKKAIVSSESKHNGERLIDLKQWREDPKGFELDRRKSHRESAEKTQESGKKKMRNFEEDWFVGNEKFASKFYIVKIGTVGAQKETEPKKLELRK
ncbi:unnamed protein product [Microthlaspi erraticum]|uniref:Uncharacterized protein n=1 Tax=Microthlaspi erraticum TaxID=1685480 RepID=A0A6D2JHC7_9BRAS|nr:unnamed protein product [Microthlaspi erraticum]